jgi:hypothetical protein
MRCACPAIVVVALVAVLAVASPARAQGQRAVLDQGLDLYQTHDVVRLGGHHLAGTGRAVSGAEE